jgi:hypothetical protein
LALPTAAFERHTLLVTRRQIRPLSAAEFLKHLLSREQVRAIALEQAAVDARRSSPAHRLGENR